MRHLAMRFKQPFWPVTLISAILALVTLAAAFNTLTARLRLLINNLQEQVAERTAQLEARVKELATLNRVTLQRVVENQPALIMLDLMMPEMDGFEFVAELRQNEGWRSIPIVVVTAKELTSEDRLWLNSAAARVLQKWAYSRHELLAQVHDLVTNGIRQAAVERWD